MSSRPVAAAATIEVMKPHYQCSKGECIAELTKHGKSFHQGLSLPELRVLLRETRRQLGLIPEKNSNPTIMDDIKKGKLQELREMCQAREIPFGPKATVGELRLILRQWVIASGHGETIYEIGNHKGATFHEVATINPGYVKWAVEEVRRSSDPDWRLMQFAHWASRMQNQEMTVETPYLSKEMQNAVHSSMNRVKTTQKGTNSTAAEANLLAEQAEVIKNLQLKMHELEQKLEEQSNSSASQKTRKTATLGRSFEVIPQDEPEGM